MRRRNFIAKVASIGAAFPAMHAVGNPVGYLLNSNRKGEIVGHGDFRYRVDTHWGQLDPQKIPIDNCHEMVIDSKGRIILLTDEPRNNLIFYDQSGNLLDAFCNRFPGGHGLTLNDEGGEEFLYVTDSGWFHDHKHPNDWKYFSGNGFVSKITMKGELVFNLGHPQTIGVYEPGMPFKPSALPPGAPPRLRPLRR